MRRSSACCLAELGLAASESALGSRQPPTPAAGIAGAAHCCRWLAGSRVRGGLHALPSLLTLGARFDIEISVIGADRHLEVMQEAFKPGQAEGVRSWVAELDRRVPGELLGTVGHREADTG